MRGKRLCVQMKAKTAHDLNIFVVLLDEWRWSFAEEEKNSKSRSCAIHKQIKNGTKEAQNTSQTNNKCRSEPRQLQWETLQFLISIEYKYFLAYGVFHHVSFSWIIFLSFYISSLRSTFRFCFCVAD